MDGNAVVRLVAERDWPKNDDAKFFRREVDTLAPFECPYVTWRGGENTGPNSFTMPWVDFDANGRRLQDLAYFIRPYNWVDNPQRAEQEALLVTLRESQSADFDDWTTQQLWDILMAVARADRFNEGVFASHAPALTIIANEIRDRLLVARERELQDGHPAWMTGE